MNNTDFVGGLAFESEEDPRTCLEAMEKYGEQHWWESADLREVAYYQMREPIQVITGRKFEASLMSLLGRQVLPPDMEFSPSNVAALQGEAEVAWKEGTPRWAAMLH